MTLTTELSSCYNRRAIRTICRAKVLGGDRKIWRGCWRGALRGGPRRRQTTVPLGVGPADTRRRRGAGRSRPGAGASSTRGRSESRPPLVCSTAAARRFVAPCRRNFDALARDFRVYAPELLASVLRQARRRAYSAALLRVVAEFWARRSLRGARRGRGPSGLRRARRRRAPSLLVRRSPSSRPCSPDPLGAPDLPAGSTACSTRRCSATPSSTP